MDSNYASLVSDYLYTAKKLNSMRPGNDGTHEVAMNARWATAAAAVDYKDWYIVVWLTPGIVQWPKGCACCQRIAETTAEARDDDEHVMASYPICRRCARHAKLDDTAMSISMAVGAIVVVGGWIAASGVSIMGWILLQLLIMVAAFVLVTVAVSWLLSFFFSAKRSQCPDDGWPVLSYRPSGFAEMLGKDAERTDEKNLRLWCEEAAKTSESGAYALQLRNSRYAREFIRANDGDASSIQTIEEEY